MLFFVRTSVLLATVSTSQFLNCWFPKLYNHPSSPEQGQYLNAADCLENYIRLLPNMIWYCVGTKMCWMLMLMRCFWCVQTSWEFDTCVANAASYWAAWPWTHEQLQDVWWPPLPQQLGALKTEFQGEAEGRDRCLIMCGPKLAPMSRL